jgi:hypothetical protein
MSNIGRFFSDKALYIIKLMTLGRCRNEKFASKLNKLRANFFSLFVVVFFVLQYFSTVSSQ